MAWRSAKLQERADLLRQVNAIEPHQRFDLETATLEIEEDLPFYPGGILLSCRALEWRNPESYLWYVKLPGQEMVALDGSVANIHHLNFHAGIHLTEDTLPSYLKFRFYFETPRRQMEEVTQIEKSGEDFICTCELAEGGQLYETRVKVDTRGVVEVLTHTAIN